MPIASGKHVLVSAPTGTGKTLAAFLAFIDQLMTQARETGITTDFCDADYFSYFCPKEIVM